MLGVNVAITLHRARTSHVGFSYIRSAIEMGRCGIESFYIPHYHFTSASASLSPSKKESRFLCMRFYSLSRWQRNDHMKDRKLDRENIALLAQTSWWWNRIKEVYLIRFQAMRIDRIKNRIETGRIHPWPLPLVGISERFRTSDTSLARKRFEFRSVCMSSSRAFQDNRMKTLALLSQHVKLIMGLLVLIVSHEMNNLWDFTSLVRLLQ